MRKIWVMMTMVVVLILSLVGCSSKSSSDGNDGKNGTVTLRIVMKDEGPSNPVAVKYFKQLSKNLKKDEGLDVKFDLVEMPQGDYAEKLNLKLTSGDIPDIIYFQGGDLPLQQQGLLENLKPYIKKSKYIKNILEPQNEKRMENYPYLLWIKPLSPSVPVIRTDWLNKLQSSQDLLNNPTVDNYYKFFKEIKDKSIGGAGKPSYAFTTAGTIADLDFIFDMAFGNTATWIKDGNGKYIYNRVSNNEKEKLAFYHKLYSDGLLDPEFLTKKWDTKEKAFYEGDTGVIVGTAGKVIDIYDGKMKSVNGDNSTLTVLPPAKGVSQGFGATDITKESRGIAISSQSKHKDLAFKVLDYLGSPKGQQLDRLGFENEEYKVVDNKVELTPKSQEWYARFWEPTKTNFPMELKTPLLGTAAQKSLDDAKKYYVENKNFILPEEDTPMWDAMENTYKEFAVDVITGKKSINDFDKFVNSWYKAGGDKITDYANKKLK